ncbi:MAG: adenylate kinase [Candidatus Aenigmarchaeota archaeon]|nr:adenylate kinase [Candidatus Aenigmarchaeota archaeon]
MKMIFLGAPGVGKGTYASRIGPKMGIPHISTGDMFREEAKAGTELGEKLNEYMQKGVLAPDELVIDILKNRLSKDDCKKGFILDGFPRTIEQAETLDNITTIDVVVNLNLRDEILIKKIVARRVCRKCGNIYNVVHIKEEGIDMPPLLPRVEGVCDKCGGELYQRDDDREDVVRERLDVHKEETSPLIEYYRKKGLVKDIDVVAGPEIMVPRILEAISKE